MYGHCVSLLFVLGSLNALNGPFRTSCTLPTIHHGKVVVRGYRGRMIKFVCDKRFELAGNKYATCRGSKWDVPIPVCIRAGCTLAPLENGIQIPTNNGAYVTNFCLPGYKMIGSPVIYCDGREWNGTAPTCVDSSQQSALSCDFEDPGLCGWTQDEMHDFDWTRLNNKTPSSFLLTGPSYDHTYGKNGSGYYMYIESTSRLRNDTARFISPIYNKALSENGCFSFFFHMFGTTCGGLRVYQKPDNVPLQFILSLSESAKNQYILFEKWGNHGDYWINSVINLKILYDNFQIVIEGIRGSSFTSDIAIDDVAILQGENCSAAMEKTTTSSIIYMPDSCAGRCMSKVPTLCGCTSTCLAYNNCCPDFLELCVFILDSTSSDDDLAPSHVSYGIPQTEKLIASFSQTTSTSPIPRSTTTSTTTTSTTTTTTSTTTTTTTTTTPRPTTTSRPSTTRRPVTRTTSLVTSPIPTITTNFATSFIPTTKLTTPRSTSRRPESKVTVRTTSPIIKSSTRIATIYSTKRPIPFTIKTSTTSTTTSSTKKPTTSTIELTTTDMSHGISRTIENHNQYHEMVEKAKKEQAIEVRKIHRQDNEKHQTSGWKVVFIVLGTVICLASVSWLLVVSRSSRGRLVLARLRGRCNQDPEVRYLTADVD